MTGSSLSSRSPRPRRLLAFSLLLLSASAGCYDWIHPLPDGTSYAGVAHPTRDVRFLADLTWIDEKGLRHVEQRIFDEAFSMIARAESFVLVDMFLYNAFQGEPPETTRALAGELTRVLIDKKRESPEISMLVISDPVNSVYGSLVSPHFRALEEAGIPVVLTRLDRLRDSNPSYSAFWRVLARPFGTHEGGHLPSPFSDEKVNVLSYLALLNFKANHRKVVIADPEGRPTALVTSANPHDGSSAHGNTAVVFGGPAVRDLIETEEAVVRFSDGELPEIRIEVPAEAAPTRVQVLTEGKIRASILDALHASGEGDDVAVAVFYISDHAVVDALLGARERGARVRALLDPNKDAFGREKNGIPNRPVAADLVDGDVDVRWCDTHGEQCHAKLLLVKRANGSVFLLVGSANFTRRNLQDLNLETNVAVRGPADAPALRDALDYFERVWSNEGGRGFSTEYPVYEDDSLRKKFLYELEERTGLSTF